jgi:hypothetical protein
MPRAHEEAERKAALWVVALHHWIIFSFIYIYLLHEGSNGGSLLTLTKDN